MKKSTLQLLRSARAIINAGWCTGFWRKTDKAGWIDCNVDLDDLMEGSVSPNEITAVCSLGGIEHALWKAGYTPHSAEWHAAYKEMTGLVYNALPEHERDDYPADYAPDAVMNFNDSLQDNAAGKKKVLGVFDAAIAQAEAAEATASDKAA